MRVDPPSADRPPNESHQTREELLAELRALRRDYVNLKILEHERDKALQALRESEERYRKIVESANDIIYRIDPSGVFVYANPAAERIMGYRLDEIRGRSFIDFVRQDYRKRTMRHYLKQTLEKTPLTYLEFPAVHKSGRNVWLGQNVQLILEGGKIVELQAVARDITEIKLAEEQRIILEGQLRQAQKMESIGRLAGGIAHDFNNILGIILAYTSILEGGKGSPQQNQMSLEAIKKAVGRAKTMVKELLTFAHKQHPELTFVDINAAARDFTNMIMETFPRTIAFSLELDPAVPGIMADPNQLDQVLLNLFVNARDAMPQGGTVTVRTSPFAGSVLKRRFPEIDRDMYVCITIEDTGIGIDDSIRPRIFEPFFSTKPQGMGSGLGLAVVYGIVRAHGGAVDVESEVGKGSAFHVYLPAARPDERKIREVRKRGKKTLGGHETILFVEDEELLRVAIGTMLEQKGYKVLLARDGIEAVEVFMKNRRDIRVVLSDLGLPRLGGWEACVTMREIDPNVRLILASGFVEPHLKAEMEKSGHNHFVQKPYEIGEVLEKVREVLDVS